MEKVSIHFVIASADSCLHHIHVQSQHSLCHRFIRLMLASDAGAESAVTFSSLCQTHACIIYICRVNTRLVIALSDSCLHQMLVQNQLSLCHRFIRLMLASDAGAESVVTLSSLYQTHACIRCWCRIGCHFVIALSDSCLHQMLVQNRLSLCHRFIRLMLASDAGAESVVTLSSLDQTQAANRRTCRVSTHFVIALSVSCLHHIHIQSRLVPFAIVLSDLFRSHVHMQSEVTLSHVTEAYTH